MTFQVAEQEFHLKADSEDWSIQRPGGSFSLKSDEPGQFTWRENWRELEGGEKSWKCSQGLRKTPFGALGGALPA